MKPGSLTSWNPLSHTRPVTGLFLYAELGLGIIILKIPFNTVKGMSI
jgi:hypothetical protein